MPWFGRKNDTTVKKAAKYLKDFYMQSDMVMSSSQGCSGNLQILRDPIRCRLLYFYPGLSLPNLKFNFLHLNI